MTIEVAEPESSPAHTQNPENLARYSQDELPKYVDCDYQGTFADESQPERTEDPVRYFGAAHGLGLIALISEASHNSSPYRATRKMLREFGDVTGLTNYITKVASDEHGVQIQNHSAMVGFDEVLANFNNPTITDTAHIIAKSSVSARFLGCMDIDTITENIQPVLMAVSDQSQKTLATTFQGHSDRTNQTNVILDTAGFKIPADDKNYVHSIPLARTLLPKIFGQTKFSPYILESGSLVLGLAYRQKLGIPNLKLLGENAELTEI